MHQQIRALPRRSPADLAEFLDVLATDSQEDPRWTGPINIAAAGGGNLESPDDATAGEFAIAVAGNGTVDEEVMTEVALARLRAARYEPHVVTLSDGLHVGYAEDKPGELLRIVQEARAANRGRVVQDIALGTDPDEPGKVVVQVYTVAPRDGRGGGTHRAMD